MFLAVLILSYLLGSVPTALIVGKLFFGVDIREHGSKNPGATNSLRVFGKTAAAAIMMVDVGKGALAAYLPHYFQLDPAIFFFKLDADQLYFGMAAVLGHCFPIFAGFRGGKAIATTAGALLISNFSLFLLCFSIFFLVIFSTKYVFVGSLSVGISLFTFSLISINQELELLFFCYLLLLIYLHRSNLRNMLLGIEPKITDKSLLNDRIPPKQI